MTAENDALTHAWREGYEAGVLDGSGLHPRDRVPNPYAVAACPSPLRCGDRSLCPQPCIDAGSRENPHHRPPVHPARVMRTESTDA